MRSEHARIAAFLIASLSLSAPVTAQSTASAESDGVGERIEVVGHWTIEVRNPDGSVAATHEFHNALTESGRETLSRLLAGDAVQGLWELGLEGTSSASSPCLVEGAPAPCLLMETIRQNPPAHAFLTLSVGSAAGAPGKLTGSATAGRDGDLGRALTWLATCNPDEYAPTACVLVSTTGALFSSADLDTPIPVRAGQLILVTVVFSFSS